MKNIKLIFILLALGLIVTFIIQNASVVEISFLFWSFQISRSLLIFIVLCLGIIAGWLISGFLRHKRQSEMN